MTTPLTKQDLLLACVERIGSQLDAEAASALERWAANSGRSAATLAAALLARPETDWETLILHHRAHRHAWFDELARRADIHDFAAYLDEIWASPAQLALLVRLRETQICDEGCAAIDRYITDEQLPVPHAHLMRRLILAVRAKAGGGTPRGFYPSLIDRTLAFYYGYYCDPWHLLGVQFANEVTSRYRMSQMGAGLERLGIADLEFIDVHLVYEDDRACDWRDSVIVPSVRARPLIRESIARGIASRLETSARHLDDLVVRARSQHAAAIAPTP